MEKGEVTAPTIHHATLTDRLSYWCGISGQVQILFSYLKNKKTKFEPAKIFHQSVKIKEIVR